MNFCGQLVRMRQTFADWTHFLVKFRFVFNKTRCELTWKKERKKKDLFWSIKKKIRSSRGHPVDYMHDESCDGV